MAARYKHITLWYRPTLAEASAEPFGVLVEAHADSVREVFGILKMLPSSQDSVTGHVLANLPEILTERLYAAAEQAVGTRPIIEVLREELAWNIYADAIEHYDADHLTLRQVAYALFAERVDVDRLGLKRFRREHIDGHGPTVGTQHTIELVA